MTADREDCGALLSRAFHDESPGYLRGVHAIARPAYLLPRLGGLFFIHALAPGLWMVSLGNVLSARGWGDLVPWAYALGPIAALISPLWIGGLADSKVEAQRLLRWLCFGSAVFLFLGFYSLDHGWGRKWFLVLHGCHCLCFTPTWSLVATVVFAHIPDPARQYPMLRLWATTSWVLAGLLVSHVMKADNSAAGGMLASGVLVLAGLYTWLIPATLPKASAGGGRRGWRATFGLDALEVFRHGDYRVFLIASGLLCIPLAAFFPFAPQLLREMDIANATAWMSLGQVAESVSMLGLAWLVMRWRIKWVMAAGLVFATVRYLMLALGAVTGHDAWIYPGLAMHGLIYTFYFVTSQIFLELRVDPAMRARAQALLTTVSGGIGSLAGTLGCGWWFQTCRRMPVDPPVQWAVFWGALALVAALALLYFMMNYRGRDAVAGDG